MLDPLDVFSLQRRVEARNAGLVWLADLVQHYQFEIGCVPTMSLEKGARGRRVFCLAFHGPGTTILPVRMLTRLDSLFQICLAYNLVAYEPTTSLVVYGSYLFRCYFLTQTPRIGVRMLDWAKINVSLLIHWGVACQLIQSV